MKYLKYILIGIILLVVVFFGRGLITSSIEYDGEVVINKPAKECWAVMSDASRISEWLPSIQKMELVSGEPQTVGAVSTIYVSENGNEMTMQETITEVVDNERMAMTYTMDFMNMVYEMNLKEVDGQTTITTHSVTEGNGLFPKAMVAWPLWFVWPTVFYSR